jgi:hypothetical protein
MDDDDLDLTDYLEAMDRALAVHEAGHATSHGHSARTSYSSR